MISGYLQRLFDRTAPQPVAALSGLSGSPRQPLPAGPSLSPIAETDQRLNDPELAETLGFGLASIASDSVDLEVDAAPLRPAKTSVKVFDIAETACGAIGSILVNDVIRCRDTGGDIAGCVDRLSTSSKLAVSLLK